MKSYFGGSLKFHLKMITINRNIVQNFPFHLVEVSPWPILVSFSLLTMAISAVMYMHEYPYGGFFNINTFVTDVSVIYLLFY